MAATSETGRDRGPVRLTHSGGLDGLRGLAVIAVLLYHAGVRWGRGGFLGVEVFFVLSGYLITSLLLAEWLRSGRIVLRRFWARRARRLLPALAAVVIVVAVYYAAMWPAQTVPGLPSDTVAAVLYYSNWHQIWTDASYFAAMGPISPFAQTWSLSIEEQFYAVWPLLVLGVLWATGGSIVCRLRVLLAVALAGAGASAVEVALMFDGGRGLDRVYLGTDTRAGGLLIGAALAIALALHRRTAPAGGSSIGRGRRAALSIAATGGLAGALAELLVSSDGSAWLFPYGLDLLDAAVATTIAGVVLMPGCLVDRLLCTRPLRAIGQISYGLYLWHFPLFLWLDAADTGESGVRLLLLRLAASVTVSVLSYVLIEQPIRRQRRPILWPAYALASLAAIVAVAVLIGAALSRTLAADAAVVSAVRAEPATPQLACRVALHNAAHYGVVPVAESHLAAFEGSALAAHRLSWHGSGQAVFATCHPQRILVIGDSISFALGLPMLGDERRYGLELADGSLLGCAFANRGELGVGGTYARPLRRCRHPLSRWAADARRFHPREVIFELGYRDEFNWRWNGHIVHLGQPAFDAYVRSQIARFIQVLGDGDTKILFLSVPYTDPPAQADGAAAVQASPTRLRLINGMLSAAAEHDPGRVAYLDLNSTISPGHHFDATVAGEPCRLDGVHPNPFCTELVEPRILSKARALLKPGAPSPR